MSVHLNETGQIIVIEAGKTLAASTATTSPYVNSAQADVTELVVAFAANATTVAADQVKIEVLAAEDSSGTNAEVVSFGTVYETLGAPGLAAGTGVPAKTQFTNSSGGGATQTSYSTTLANGSKQIQVVVPIRGRQTPSGKTWIAFRLTAGTNPRGTLTTVAIRTSASYGADNPSGLSLL